MRIAVVAPLVTPLLPAQAGGSQAFASDLAVALRRQGHEVALFCADGSRVRGVRLITVAVPAAARAALVMPAGPAPPVAPALAEVFEMAYALVRRWRPDAVSQHAFDAEAIQLADGLPVLHTLHLPPLVPAMSAAALSVPGRLATVSEACRRDWQAAGVNPRVLRNGVPDMTLRRGPELPVALIAGRVSPEKGTAHSVAAARAAGLRPLVVGTVFDAEYHRREVREPVRQLPRRQLWSLMARVAVTVMLVDWEEPFGLVAAEAQVAGCPVVATARGGLPEVVEHGVGGFLVAPGEDPVPAVRAALGLDRERVRRSGRARLLIGPAAAAYARALGEIA